ncbi:VQ motif-containing protein 19-like [Nymphaea colorata]|uniref:VQ motif-containing protein 19-like n=1 Tax=Nymphaea colorata TaxID=210225 RepID=UPI00129DC300|nr:VQ motif-containing protein 19-like [Nymphaea colorata]
METPISNGGTAPAASSTGVSISTASSPTTFVQADPRSFKDLVQKLTGVAEDSPEKLPITLPARYANRTNAAGGMDPVGPRRSAFKLHERRHGGMRKLEVKLGLTSLRAPHLSPRSQLLLSPTTAAVSDLLLSSPVTPLDPFENGLYSPNSGCFLRISSPGSGSESTSPVPVGAMSEEEKAIAEKGFYLHPSPLNTPRGTEPELLPLFPLQSPRQSAVSSTTPSFSEPGISPKPNC